MPVKETVEVRYCYYDGTEYREIVEGDFEALTKEAEAKFAEFARIVRCKDCKFWAFTAEGDFGIQYGECRCDIWVDECHNGRIMTGEDYCSYAKNK